MEFYEEIIFNITLISFPMLIYFIYRSYCEITNNKYNNMIFDITIVISLYVLLKYGIKENINILLLFCNIPIFICYVKNKWTLGLILSIYCILYAYFSFDYNICFLLIKYICFYITYLFINKINKQHNLIISLYIVQGFFLSFESFSVNNTSNIIVFIKLILMVLTAYIISILNLYLLNLSDKITNLYSKIKTLEHEKEIKESLFKLTHEIKNPIAVCKGYLDMMDLNDKEKTERYIPIIREEIDRSLNIMTDFMQLNKINLNKEIIDINMMLDDIYENFKIINKSNNINLIYTSDESEIYIDGDYNRLTQVFVNLIKNSKEAIKGKGKIIIESKINKDNFEIYIIDNGIGMDKDTLKQIKEIFYTTKDKGSGIGVSLSNEIIKAHGGKLEYYSTPGKGTTTKVILPIMKNF